MNTIQNYGMTNYGLGFKSNRKLDKQVTETLAKKVLLAKGYTQQEVDKMSLTKIFELIKKQELFDELRNLLNNQQISKETYAKALNYIA